MQAEQYALLAAWYAQYAQYACRVLCIVCMICMQSDLHTMN